MQPPAKRGPADLTLDLTLIASDPVGLEGDDGDADAAGVVAGQQTLVGVSQGQFHVQRGLPGAVRAGRGLVAGVAQGHGLFRDGRGAADDAGLVLGLQRDRDDVGELGRIEASAVRGAEVGLREGHGVAGVAAGQVRVDVQRAVAADHFEGRVGVVVRRIDADHAEVDRRVGITEVVGAIRRHIALQREGRAVGGRGVGGVGGEARAADGDQSSAAVVNGGVQQVGSQNSQAVVGGVRERNAEERAVGRDRTLVDRAAGQSRSGGQSDGGDAGEKRNHFHWNSPNLVETKLVDRDGRSSPDLQRCLRFVKTRVKKKNNDLPR
uniref:LigA n=1 Tax=Parastrongyloides trichosuri TaxID=131310 RepID=A0A0N4ZXV2_PARTI